MLLALQQLMSATILGDNVQLYYPAPLATEPGTLRAKSGRAYAYCVGREPKSVSIPSLSALRTKMRSLPNRTYTSQEE